MERRVEKNFRFFQPKQLFEYDQVPRTTDRQEFGKPLHNAKKNGFKIVHRTSPPPYKKLHDGTELPWNEFIIPEP